MSATQLDSATNRAPGGKEAREWAATFEPVAGVDYDWAVEAAERQYAALRLSFDKIDEKATHVINYVASGAGLFTLGSLAVVYAAKVPVVAVWCALPAMLFAVAAVICALVARWPRDVFPPPKPQSMAKAAELYPADPKRGRAMMLPQWEWTTALLKGTIEGKAWWFAWASNCMAAAVVSLLVPLVVALENMK